MCCAGRLQWLKSLSILRILRTPSKTAIHYNINIALTSDYLLLKTSVASKSIISFTSPVLWTRQFKYCIFLVSEYLQTCTPWHNALWMCSTWTACLCGKFFICLPCAKRCWLPWFIGTYVLMQVLSSIIWYNGKYFHHTHCLHTHSSWRTLYLVLLLAPQTIVCLRKNTSCLPCLCFPFSIKGTYSITPRQYMKQWGPVFLCVPRDLSRICTVCWSAQMSFCGIHQEGSLSRWACWGTFID